MAKQSSIALANITSQAANAAKDVSMLTDASIYVGGTFAGTYSVLESPDGATFVATQSGKTAPGVWDLSPGTKQVKVSCTTYTSGTIVSVVGGRDANRL